MKNLVLLLVVLPVIACAGPSGSDVPQGNDNFQPDPRPMARTLVYECEGGAEFLARIGPGEMALWFEDRYLVLSQVRSGSGTRYEEGDVVLMSKGDEAMLDINGRSYRDCRLNPARAPWEDARRRGVDFRAVGNEPGWLLEARGEERLLFSGDYGASKFLFSEIDGTMDAEQRYYEARSGDSHITVSAAREDCTDSMSGEVFPYTVEVYLNQRRYAGCGRELDHPW